MRATTDRINELAGIIDTAARHLGEGTANITEEGITLKGMNKAHVVYIETVIYSTFFTEYQADEEEHAGIDYEELAPVIKSITADEATLTITEGMVRVDAEEHGGTIRSFHLPTLTYEYTTPERPNIEYNEYVDIPISVLESALRDAALIKKMSMSEALTIKTTEDHIIFSAGEEGMAAFRAEYLHGCRVTKPQTSKYTLEHLQGIIPSITDTVTLGFKDDSPLHLQIRGDGVDFEALIAPRIIG